MTAAPNRIALTVISGSLVACSGSPSVSLPMTGHWQWTNSNASYVISLDDDKVTCISEADRVKSRITQCDVVQPTPCEKLTDNVAKAMCQYSNTTTKNMCLKGRMEIPEQEIVDGCIAARGWHQVWMRN